MDTKKIAIIGLSLGFAGYATWRLFLNPVTAHADEVEPGQLKPSKSDSGFPLKLGSIGEKVRELQAAIGAINVGGIDGKFGGNTEKAVKAALGKTTVDSQNDIDTISAKREGAEYRANGSKRADEIIQKFQAPGSNLCVMFTHSSIGDYYKQDYSGALVFNRAKNLMFKPNVVLSRSNMTITGKTKSGYLLVKYRGSSYRVSPSDVTLVEPGNPKASLIQIASIAATANMWV